MDGPSKGKGPVEASMMKQIAGRAGRRSSQYRDQGIATCLNDGDMPWLRQAVSKDIEAHLRGFIRRLVLFLSFFLVSFGALATIGCIHHALLPLFKIHSIHISLFLWRFVVCIFSIL